MPTLRTLLHPTFLPTPRTTPYTNPNELGTEPLLHPTYTSLPHSITTTRGTLLHDISPCTTEPPTIPSSLHTRTLQPLHTSYVEHPVTLHYTSLAFDESPACEYTTLRTRLPTLPYDKHNYATNNRGTLPTTMTPTLPIQQTRTQAMQYPTGPSTYYNPSLPYNTEQPCTEPPRSTQTNGKSSNDTMTTNPVDPTPTTTTNDTTMHDDKPKNPTPEPR